jgi:spore maturation protein CgeB
VRFLLLNTDYQTFIDELHRADPALAEASYDDQLTARNATFFGVGNAYARALRARGHEAHDIHVNNAAMQAAWLTEHGGRGAVHPPTRHLGRRRRVPWPRPGPSRTWLLRVLAAQIEALRPDVILNHDISWFAPEDLRRVAGAEVTLVGQHAAPPYPDRSYRAYDLVVSSWPPTIERMRRQGIRAEHLGLGFDPHVLEVVGRPERDIPLSFVGSIGALHGERTAFLETLCATFPATQIFGPSVDAVPPASPIRACYRGPAFGVDMFRVLARSRATLNHHGFPEPHANNMRLFEATGAGSLLLTDAKPDLDRYFEDGREVLTYSDLEGCVALVGRTVDDPQRAVAEAGQRRTLAEHTWEHRIGELLAILGAPPATG